MGLGDQGWVLSEQGLHVRLLQCVSIRGAGTFKFISMAGKVDCSSYQNKSVVGACETPCLGLAHRCVLCAMPGVRKRHATCKTRAAYNDHMQAMHMVASFTNIYMLSHSLWPTCKRNIS